MEVSELIQTLAEFARPLGYRRKGTLFWKRYPELTTLIHLQCSRWSDGVYINLGATPNAMVTKPTPPGAGYWGTSRRSESIDSPFKEQFEGLALDATDVDAANMTEPLRWLLTWIEENLADADRLRQELLDLEPNQIISNAGAVPCMMRDWAHGRLLEPSKYFAGTPYYR